MKQLWALCALGAVGIALGVSCGSDSLNGPAGMGGAGGLGSSATGGRGTGGIGGSAGTDLVCDHHAYLSSGCGGAAVLGCVSGTGGSCASAVACSCSGKVINPTACGEYEEPYAYLIDGVFETDGGMTCDPKADGGN